jgi:serine protease Do
LLNSDRLHGQPPGPPVLPRELTSYRDVARRVLPAVVSIEAKALRKPAAAAPKRPLPPGVGDDLRRFFDAPVDPRGPDPDPGFGSGFVIDPTGVVLTNYHVVEGVETVEVQLPDGRKFTTPDIRRDPKTDLAVIKVTADRPLPAIDLGDSDAMEVGDRVLAFGAPFGLTGSVTAGIVSAKSRQNLRLNQYEDFLQTDAAMNPGNSGGPLVNLEGRAVGITAAIKTRGGGSNGVGLAVSSNLARDVVRQLLADGVVRRGYLGVAVNDIDPAVAARVGAPGGGVLVTRAYDGGPAAAAGVQAGDVLVTVAGAAVKDVTALPRVVAGLPLGKPAEVVYARDGKLFAVQVTIAEQPAAFGADGPPAAVPPQPPARGGVPVAGMTVADLTPEAAARLRFPKGSRGAVVVGVDRTGPAAEAGVAPGVLVVKVDRTPVGSAAEFRQALAAADKEKGVLLQLLRPTGEADFVVLKVR